MENESCQYCACYNTDPAPAVPLVCKIQASWWPGSLGRGNQSKYFLQLNYLYNYQGKYLSSFISISQLLRDLYLLMWTFFQVYHSVLPFPY